MRKSIQNCFNNRSGGTVETCQMKDIPLPVVVGNVINEVFEFSIFNQNIGGCTKQFFAYFHRSFILDCNM